MSGQKNYISSCIWLNSHRRGHGHDFTVASSGCWIFLYVAFNIYLYYLYYGYCLSQCGIIYWCVWWGIFNVEFNSWNLYSSCRWHLCWNTIEKLIEIDSTRIFIMYVHVWPGYNVMEIMGLFAGSVLQVISPHDQIRIDQYIQLIIAHDSHMCAWNYYILDS